MGEAEQAARVRERLEELLREARPAGRQAGPNPVATRRRDCPAEERRSGSAAIEARRRSSPSIAWSGEFEAAAANGGGAASSAGKAPAVFGAGAGRGVSVTRNPTRARAATPRLIPRTIGRTRDRRGSATIPFDAAPAGSPAGGSRMGSSGGGRAWRQVGYGFCPANRTGPRIFSASQAARALDRTCRIVLRQKQQSSC